MTKKFTKLNIGSTVVLNGSKCFKKLSVNPTSSDITGDFTDEPVAYGNFLTFSSPKVFVLATANSAKNWDGEIEYSRDANNWYVWDGTTSLLANKGRLYLRGTWNTIITGKNRNSNWVLTGTNIDCSGNIEALRDYALAETGEYLWMDERCYYRMFYGCTSLISAPELPYTGVSFEGYRSMFEGCENLISAPSLPATHVQDFSYCAMFRNCTSLSSLPAIYATWFQMWCCDGMFENCTNIKISTTQTGEYQTAYRIPASGTGEVSNSAVFADMFAGTGGTFKGSPRINTTYYTSNTVV